MLKWSLGGVDLKEGIREKIENENKESGERKNNKAAVLKIAPVILKYGAVFCGTAALLALCLFLSAFIPRSSIEGNVLASAEYLMDGDNYEFALDGVFPSMTDNYADSVLLGIALQYDASDPLSSVMRSAYYVQEGNTKASESLMAAAEGNLEANRQYLRYWHGSIAIVRPLLVLMPVSVMYVLNGAILLLLAVLLIIKLLRIKAYVPAFGTAAGMAAASFWFVPFSLEYTWVCLLALLFSVIAVFMAEKNRYGGFAALFLVSGIVTNFLDFLTAETLTLLVPLLLALWMSKKKENENAPRPRVLAVKSGAAWLFGYAGMWVAKWVLAGIILQEDITPYVAGNIAERLDGSVMGAGTLELVFGALLRNIGCLFPAGYYGIGTAAAILIIVYALYYGFVYKRSGFSGEFVLVYVIVGLVPFVRFMVLHNHAYMHFFFTCRALMASVLAVVLVLGEITERRRRGVIGKKGARSDSRPSLQG